MNSLAGNVAVVALVLLVGGGSSVMSAEAPTTRAAGPTTAPSTEPTRLPPAAILLTLASVKGGPRFGVHYVRGPQGTYAPGYVDRDTNAVLRWKGVEMTWEDCPKRMRTFSGIMAFNNTEGPGRRPIIDIDPPVRYQRLPDGRFAAGYYEPSSDVFYRWPAPPIDKGDLPAGLAEDENLWAVEQPEKTVVDGVSPPSTSNSLPATGGKAR